jgi:hydrogenase expression/formation protein HypE
MSRDSSSSIVCPVPLEPGDQIQLGHGGGGRLTARLIERVLVPAFDNPQLAALDDGATLEVAGGRLACTTDSFVVTPPFFPGGDIGSLSIYGTANDLAMCGADPLFFSAGLILEEGFPIASLERVVASMAAACRRVGAPLVTGDTKVVDRGKGDGIFINTAGVGRVRPGVSVSSRGARPGDVVLVSGPVGDHGIAVMARREGIALKTELQSDCAPVLSLVAALCDAAPDVRVLRDPTRGGLATALCEIAAASGVGMNLVEAAIPVRDEVRGACELLGLDPLYVACEGRFLAIVPREREEAALLALRALADGASAARIGEVTEARLGAVRLRTPLGSYRVLERHSGEQLPRIC